MCRFLAYSGAPIFLEDLVCKPQHSLVRQSMQADEAKVATNGDGFGLGWYAERPEPGVYREVTPAWSDENLLALCAAVRSPLFFAHVRATTGTAVARQNCHPFHYGKYLFMHNGQIGDFPKVRRDLEAALPDHLYAQRKGATDSELMFLMAMHNIEMGAGPIDAMGQMLGEVLDAMKTRGCAAPLRFAAVLSDGAQVDAFRFSSDEKPPTLYLCKNGGCGTGMTSGVVIASEPLQDRNSPACPEWIFVPPTSAVTVIGGKVEIAPLRVAALAEA